MAVFDKRSTAKKPSAKARLVLTAQDPSTTEPELRRLFKKPTLHPALAQNPNLPYDLLLSLAAYHADHVLQNPAFSLLCLEHPEKLQSQPYIFTHSICRSPYAPAFLLHLFAQHSIERFVGSEDTLRGLIARNPNTQAETLALLYTRLGFHPDLAKHPNAPPHLLRRCLLHEQPAARACAVLHPQSPTHLLSLLRQAGFSSDLKVEPKVFGALPEHEYEPIFNESDYMARLIACSVLTPESALIKLAKHSSKLIRGKVAANPVLPVEGAESLSRDPDFSVRQSLAQNLTTPVAILQRAAQDRSRFVRRAAAQNRYIPLHILRALSKDTDGEVRDAAMSHPKFQNA